MSGNDSYPTIKCPDCGGQLRELGTRVEHGHAFTETQCSVCKTMIQVLTKTDSREQAELASSQLLPFRRINLYDTSPTKEIEK